MSAIENLKILLVEDREEDIYFMQLIINSIGDITLFVARNGLEALQKLDEVAPHCILLDINMPLMNGLEFLKIIKTDPATPVRYAKTPVFVLTTSSLKDDIITAYRLHAALYFVKPHKVSLTKALIIDLKTAISKAQLAPYEVL